MILAIDLGGTKLQYGIFECRNGRDRPEAESSCTVGTEQDFLSQIKGIVREARQSHDLSMISIGVPGPTSNNIMHGSYPLNYSASLDFRGALGEFGVPVIARNDLNMAMHCELFLGAGRNARNFCLLSLSTGIGLAVVIDGVILDRKIELGHQVLHPDLAPAIPCINHSNCWASLASGAGITARFATRQHTTTEDIFKYVLTEQDIRAIRTYNAHGIGSIVNAYDPEVIVVMGSLGLIHFEQIIPGKDEIAAFTVNRPVPDCVGCHLHDEIGMLGAYFAAMSSLPSHGFV